MNTEYVNRLNKIENILRKALPGKEASEEERKLWMELSFGKEYEGVEYSHTLPLLEPCIRLVKAGGKRWRPLLLVLCAEMQKASSNNKKSNNINDDLPYELTPLLEYVHTASLIHDDIEDNADTRRGLPAAHISFGLDTALNAGSWLYFEAASCINSCKASDEMKLKLYQLYTNELRRLHLGQAMDIAWHRDNKKMPSSKEYLAMVKNKTGTLAALAAKTGILAGGGSFEDAETVGEIAAEIGAGFQVLDDVINITTGNVGKKRGDDIVEGKKSLPVLYFMNETDFESKEVEEKEKLELLNCFKKASKGGIDSPEVEKAINLLEKRGAIKKAAKDAEMMIDSSCEKLNKIYSNNAAASLIVNLFKSMIPNRR
ncbi:MAG: polyprenyl synthetase family protein [Treponema sp.]|nr:polyprenyl synthetase family protein [Treponema sp.]